MKRFTLLVFLFTFFTSIVFSQTGSIKGKVLDDLKKEPLGGVVIEVSGSNLFTVTGDDGTFKLEKIATGKRTIIINMAGFEALINDYTIEEGKTKDIGTVKLSPETEAEVSHEPIVTISSSELAGDEESANISGLLHGSKDVFTSTAGYTFGPMRFRVRGYDSKYTTIYMNGIPMNNMETGRAYWANWGGLNDVTRNKETYIGLEANEFGFGSVGGYTNINTRAALQRKNTQVTYSRSNRSYNNRVMLTGSYTLGNDTWLTVSGSKRWAEEGYVEGTFYDAYGYFLALEKKLGDKHSLLFTGFGAPSRRGKQGASTQDVYDALDDNYYNPYWGYQEGEKRNSRVGIYHKPTFLLNHAWEINNSSTLRTSAAYKFGKGGSTSLSWYDAHDPRPDYYKNFPDDNYLNPASYDKQIEAFKNDPSVSQLNWDYFYTVNHYNHDTIDNVDGINGKTVSGKRSQFIVEERRTDQQFIAATTNFQKQLNENITVTTGVQYRDFTGSSYKLVNDLLGGDYWVDVDKYAERDAGMQSRLIEDVHNDLRTPNHVVEEGDRFGYDYDANIWDAKVWAQSEFSFNKVDFFVTGEAVNTEMWRTGYMQNGKFPDASLGDSEKKSFINYGGKTGALYKISGRHYLSAHGGYITNPPTFELVFVSPRTRDYTNENAVSETIYSGDIGYNIRAPKVKASLNLYYTQFEDQSDIFYFYNDLEQSFGAYFLSDINKVHRGIELGLETKITPSLSATGVGAFGYYHYTSRPKGTMIVDESAEVKFKDRTIYVENFKEPGTPQTAASVGLKYFSSKYWFLGTNANYVDDIFLSFNPERRTVEGSKVFDYGSPTWEEAIAQEKLPDAFTLDFFGGKSFKWDDYYLLITLNASNVLNNTEFITGGYEQSRIDPEGELGKFPPKYYYYYGTTFYFNIRFSFK